LANNNHYYDGNHHLNGSTPRISPEEQNELDALDIVIGLSREERSYLLSVWRSGPTTSVLVRAVNGTPNGPKMTECHLQDRAEVDDGK
jgi:hypothetical protein